MRTTIVNSESLLRFETPNSASNERLQKMPTQKFAPLLHLETLDAAKENKCGNAEVRKVIYNLSDFQESQVNSCNVFNSLPQTSFSTEEKTPFQKLSTASKRKKANEEKSCKLYNTFFSKGPWQKFLGSSKNLRRHEDNNIKKRRFGKGGSNKTDLKCVNNRFCDRTNSPSPDCCTSRESFSLKSVYYDKRRKRPRCASLESNMKSETLKCSVAACNLSGVGSEVKLPITFNPNHSIFYLRSRLLGSGSYGSVYLERDCSNKVLIACKEIALRSVSKGEDVTSEFLNSRSCSHFNRCFGEKGQTCLLMPEKIPISAVREMTLCSQLKHENIVKFHDVHFDHRNLYIMMEYIPKTLSDFVASYPPGLIPKQEFYILASDLFSGLSYLHSRCPPVIHRDLKFDNLLVQNGRLKICDFSLARECNGQDVLKILPNSCPMTPQMSTLRYSAPEILLGSSDYSVQADVWAAGVIVAELMSGQKIFSGKTEIERMTSILEAVGGCYSTVDSVGIMLVDSLEESPLNRHIASKCSQDWPDLILSGLSSVLSIEASSRMDAVGAHRLFSSYVGQ